MDKYFNLLAEKKKVNQRLNEERDRMHRILLKIHRETFRWLDIGVIAFILFNAGALLITNALVPVSAPIGEEIEYLEANTKLAEEHNLKVSPNGDRIYWMFLRGAIGWALLLFWYVYVRRTVYTERMLYFILGGIILIDIVAGIDFINDLGYLIGEVIR